MTMLLQNHETLVQVPPTRVWGSGHAPILQRIGKWLPKVPKPKLSRTDLVRRYLTAFGPASVADMQTWCRLTRLGGEFKALADELLTFEDADGRTLYDLPDAPRPDEDTPAPVRFLPLFDSVYLGYADRRRMLSAATANLQSMFRAFKPTVLIDGRIDAGWTIDSNKGAAVLEIEPYRKLLKREVLELEQEGLSLLKFMQPEATSWDVTFAP
jgi:hypothetical protein